MRAINISNEKKRNAQVGFEVKRNKTSIDFVCEDGSPRINVRLLKSTLETEPENLVNKYGDISKLGEAILNGDPEIDMEKVGMTVKGTRKIFLSEEDKIVYRLKRSEVLFNPDGTEKAERPYVETVANANGEFPLLWTGKLIPKEKAIRMFVFTRKYQIKHVNGLTYDFLYEMAKTLQEKKCMMLIGGGAKGNEPIVLSAGGTSYRGFLEGRVDGDKYCLILHFTNLELKAL
jgi:hypothetical protein